MCILFPLLIGQIWQICIRAFHLVRVVNKGCVTLDMVTGRPVLTDPAQALCRRNLFCNQNPLSSRNSIIDDQVSALVYVTLASIINLHCANPTRSLLHLHRHIGPSRVRNFAQPFHHQVEMATCAMDELCSLSASLTRKVTIGQPGCTSDRKSPDDELSLGIVEVSLP
jgi:hypothetical protein